MAPGTATLKTEICFVQREAVPRGSVHHDLVCTGRKEPLLTLIHSQSYDLGPPNPSLSKHCGFLVTPQHEWKANLVGGFNHSAKYDGHLG